jgi:hypothetical protein
MVIAILFVIVKNLAGTRLQWLMPGNLTTEEAEIRRITVQSQPQASSS